MTESGVPDRLEYDIALGGFYLLATLACFGMGRDNIESMLDMLREQEGEIDDPVEKAKIGAVILTVELAIKEGWADL